MVKRILLLAGEQSGIFYAGRLKEALAREQSARGGEPIEFRGYSDYGFKTVDLAVMGVLPVLRKLFYFLGVARTMKKAIREWRPDVVVTIDYPGMNLKLAAYAKALGIPAVHIVCPQVWAWHRGRVPKIAAALNKLLCFFPFEPAIFAAENGKGFEAKFIGHPLVDICAEESARLKMQGPSIEGLDVPSGRRIVALLPGSRHGEIERILPRQLAAAKLLNGRTSDLHFVIPAANARARRQIEAELARDPVDNLTVIDGQARDLLRASCVAAVASGTATLESALARVPTALVYATTPTFAWFLRYFVTGVRFAGLVNIIAERCAFGGKDPPKRRPGEGPGKGGPMPELLQEEFTPEALAGILGAWLTDDAARSGAIDKIDGAMALIRSDGDAIGNAAREILA
jgi:lipid-A-disaccharide synthase